MIMIYDGNKTMILESVLKENTISTQNIQQNIMGRVVTNVIALEAVSSAKDGKLETTIASPVALKQKDSHVIFDFAKLSIVWCRDISAEEAEALGITKKFVDPIQAKFEKLLADERKEEEQKFDKIISDQVNVHLQKAGVTIPATPAQPAPPPAAAPVTTMEVENMTPERVPAEHHVQMHAGGIPGVTNV